MSRFEASLIAERLITLFELSKSGYREGYTKSSDVPNRVEHTKYIENFEKIFPETLNLNIGQNGPAIVYFKPRTEIRLHNHNKILEAEIILDNNKLAFTGLNIFIDSFLVKLMSISDCKKVFTEYTPSTRGHRTSALVLLQSRDIKRWPIPPVWPVLKNWIQYTAWFSPCID
ncbi:hypothetical protein FF38_02428 [Lucilia cuprina]|uniref:Uncharacterized protein n=1 Tax=Lucilia cuprina TaxID=7375 RepID=A0A0L0CAN4_LUCCU|nr:hypothetical protein FF38_02428 [Lucilia cuprina]